MIATKKMTFAFMVICFFAVKGMAQTSLSVYPFNNAFGIKFLSDKKISTELRLNFQVDMAHGESAVYVNPELFATVNFLRKEQFIIYSGIAVGANLYNLSSSNFTCSVPFGGTYFLGTQKRFGIMAECGLKLVAGEQIKLNSYALGGLVLRFRE